MLIYIHILYYFLSTTNQGNKLYGDYPMNKITNYFVWNCRFGKIN